VSTTVYIPRLNVMLQGDCDQSYNQTTPHMVRAPALPGLCAMPRGTCRCAGCGGVWWAIREDGKGPAEISSYWGSMS
jgi:hypothetical protein